MIIIILYTSSQYNLLSKNMNSCLSLRQLRYLIRDVERHQSSWGRGIHNVGSATTQSSLNSRLYTMMSTLTKRKSYTKWSKCSTNLRISLLIISLYNMLFMFSFKTMESSIYFKRLDLKIFGVISTFFLNKDRICPLKLFCLLHLLNGPKPSGPNPIFVLLFFLIYLIQQIFS